MILGYLKKINDANLKKMITDASWCLLGIHEFVNNLYAFLSRPVSSGFLWKFIHLFENTPGS